MIQPQPDPQHVAADVGNAVLRQQRLLPFGRLGMPQGEEARRAGEWVEQLSGGERGVRKTLGEALFQARHPFADPGGGQPFARQHAADVEKAVQRGRIKGRAHEAHRVAGIAGLPRRQGQILEFGIPAGYRRARTEAWRAVHQAEPFAGHRILVTAGEKEAAFSKRAQRLGHGHEAMVAVDDDPRSFRRCNGGECLKAGNQPPGAEHQLADHDEVGVTCPRRESLGEGVVGLGRQHLQRNVAAFGPARELAAGAVEFTAGGQHAQPAGRAAGGGGPQADKKIVGIAGKDDRVRLAGAELCRDRGLRFGPQFAHHPLPFAVGKPRGVFPAFDLAGEAGVGPQVVAVRRHVQALRRRRQAAGKEMLEAHSCVRIAQSSGNARFSRVEAR